MKCGQPRAAYTPKPSEVKIGSDEEAERDEGGGRLGIFVGFVHLAAAAAAAAPAAAAAAAVDEPAAPPAAAAAADTPDRQHKQQQTKHPTG